MRKGRMLLHRLYQVCSQNGQFMNFHCPHITIHTRMRPIPGYMKRPRLSRSEFICILYLIHNGNLPHSGSFFMTVQDKGTRNKSKVRATITLILGSGGKFRHFTGHGLRWLVSPSDFQLNGPFFCRPFEIELRFHLLFLSRKRVYRVWLGNKESNAPVITQNNQ